MIFEKEDFDPMEYYFKRRAIEEEIKEMEEYPYDCEGEAVLKYISQVRNNGGFDVDVYVPAWLHPRLVYFIPVVMSYPISKRDFMYDLAKFAIAEINVDMKSKTFELVEVVKAVSSVYCLGLMYLTLAVKNREEAATITIQAIVCYHCRGPLDPPAMEG